MFEALPETASHIENTYKDVVPMDEDAKLCIRHASL